MLYPRKKKDKHSPLFDKIVVTVRKKSDYKKKLDEVFSMYIRLRDSKEFGYRAFRCVSCGIIKPFSEADCGHYFSRSHLATRFDELNCWAECRDCNRINSDHLKGYQRNLIKKIGKERFELLEEKHNTYCKIDEDDYRKMIKNYTLLVGNLKNNIF